MSLTGEIQGEAPEWAQSYRGCFWLVNDLLDGKRPCGNSGTNHFGPHMAFCGIHERKFVDAVMIEIEENTKLRGRLIRHIIESERDEAGMWDRHRSDVRDLPVVPGRAHCVYFAEREGFVKIGRTVNVAKRMHDIGKGSCMPQGMSVGPVRLLALIYCACEGRGCVRERHYHDAFRDKWLEGEWFLLDHELRAFIGGLQDCLDDQLRAVSMPVPAHA